MRAVKALARKWTTLSKNRLSIMACAALTACQYVPPAPAPQKPPHAVSATRIVGTHSAFDLVNKKTSRTPRADLFRLVNALDKAYGVLDFAPPYPAIRIAGPGHSALRGSALARAQLNEDGDAVIYFNRHELIRRPNVEALVLHELAHLKAWRIHGTDIATHGSEFLKICYEVTTRDNCAAKER